MSWSNLPADNSTDWTQVDFLRQFQYALDERVHALNGSVGNWARRYPRIVASTDAIEDIYGNAASNGHRAFLAHEEDESASTKKVVEFDGSEWGEPDWTMGVDPRPHPDTLSSTGLFEAGDYAVKISPNPTSATLIRQLQAATESTVTSGFGHRFIPAPEGSAPYASLPSNYTTATWRADAGIPADGFTRKFPRIVADIEAVEDIYGNAAEVGQRAFLALEDDATASTQEVVEFDGSEWIEPSWDPETDARPHPDVLEANGIFQRGDYVGPWLWNEMYQGIDVLRWTRQDRTVDRIRQRNGQVSGNGSCGSAISEAIAEWSVDGGFNVGANVAYQTVHWESHDPEADPVDEYHSVCYSGDFQTDPALTHSPDIARTERLYYSFLTPGSSAGHTSEFSASHLGVTAEENKYTLMDERTGVTGASSGAFEFLKWDAQPPSPSCPSSVGGHIFAGCRLAGGNWLMQWDVAGGFEYVD